MISKILYSFTHIWNRRVHNKRDNIRIGGYIIISLGEKISLIYVYIIYFGDIWLSYSSNVHMNVEIVNL